MVAFPENNLREKLSHLILEAGAPGKHCSRSALRHIEKAFAISEISPEMAVFQALTAEEEAASAVFHALKRRNYAGAERLQVRNHVHKMALSELYKAIADRFTVLSEGNIFPHIQIEPEGDKEFVRVAIETEPLIGKPGWLCPFPPLNFRFAINEKEDDFSEGFAAISSQQSTRSILKHLRQIANKRNLALYAQSNGIPHIERNLDGFLVGQDKKVTAHLAIFMMIDPYEERQLFVQQSLDAFLKVLNLLPDTL